MRVVVLDAAEADYYDAYRWYESAQSGLGDEFLDELRIAFESLKDDPDRLPLLETVEVPGHEIRRCRLKRFPFYLVVEVVGDEVRVAAVHHYSRDPHYWLDRIQ